MHRLRTFILLIILSQVFLVGCAHYPNVRPASNGVHEVSFLTDRNNQGYKDALREAKSFCDDRYKQYPVVVSEESKYIGTMDEKTYNASKTAAEVVGAVGLVGAVLGEDQKDRSIGSAAVVGSGVVDNAIGSGYRFTMMFKCQ